jgi:hypothetical protein
MNMSANFAALGRVLIAVLYLIAGAFSLDSRRLK